MTMYSQYMSPDYDKFNAVVDECGQKNQQASSGHYIMVGVMRRGAFPRIGRRTGTRY
jgi:hypothetical protein